MSSANKNMHRYCLAGQPVDVFAEVTFGANAAPTLVTSNDKSFGVKAVVQALASSKIYGFALRDPFVRLKCMSACFMGVPNGTQTDLESTASNLLPLADASSGGFALISVGTNANAADTVTLMDPAGTVTTFTAVAYDATPTDKQFCIGNTTGADAECANNIAAVIRNDSDDSDQAGKGDTNANGGWAAKPSTITAYAQGTVVVVVASVPGWRIATSNITRLAFKSGATGVAATLLKMDPGVVVASVVGVTETLPTSGDLVKANFVFENAQRSI